MSRSSSLLAPRKNPGLDSMATLSVSQLRLGARLRLPIYEDGDNHVLLLASGTTVTPALLHRLKNRGVTRVRVDRSEVQRLLSLEALRNLPKPNTVQDAPLEIERFGNSRWARSPKSFVNNVQSHGSASYDHKSVTQFAASFNDSLQQVETLFDGLAVGEVGDAAKMAAVSTDSLMKITEDLDLFVATGMAPATDKYPCKHSLQVAMLAMSIGTLLGLEREELVELGVGCLIHDAGMLHIKTDLIQSNRPLGRIEFLEITKHPIVTYDLMQKTGDIPLGSRMVAYQMHERCNGTGYPRRRGAMQIHYLAKVAMVADVFVALVSPRPHRPGMLPYHAMAQILEGASEGLYDPMVVRALLHTVSLFPIGSYIELDDGRIGKVVRSNRESYTKPVVEVWNPAGPDAGPEVVDLTRESYLQIARPLPSLIAPTTPLIASSDLDYWE